jgi:hypothetical protein
MDTNSSQKEKDSQIKNDELQNIGLLISKIALIVWLIPGLFLISDIVTHNTSFDNKKITFEQLEQVIDKTINRNIDLINLLLFIVTAIPLIGNMYFWFLYNSVREGLIDSASEKINKD